VISYARRLVPLVMAAPFGAAISQSVQSPRAPYALTLRIDNDAFDYWRMPWNRPDDEYSSGVHIDYDGGDAPVWARALARNAVACTDGALACRTQRLELGQDIYTPATSAEAPQPAPGSRPNAGWLYLAQTARVLSAARSDEATITVGVTGNPSLARYMQTLVHRVAPAYNRPIDWSNQIGFEPGIIARYEQRRRAVALSAGDIGWDVIPRAGASVGNVSTEADAGVQTRLGWKLPHPWLPQSRATSVSLLAGASERAVARDLFLDGSTFGGGPRVGHEPWVTSGELGIELRYERLTLAYRVQSDSRAYARGPAWHPWASMVGGFTFER
jgi:hypothetical protein